MGELIGKEIERERERWVTFNIYCYFSHLRKKGIVSMIKYIKYSIKLTYKN